MYSLGMFGYNASVPMYSYNLSLVEQYLKAAIIPSTGHSYWDDGFDVVLFYNAGNTVRLGRARSCSRPCRA